MSLVRSSSCWGAAACAEDDLSCIRRDWLAQTLQLKNYGAQLALKDSKIRLLDDTIVLLQQQRDTALKTSQELLKVSSQLQSHWWQSPLLWMAIGAVIATTLAIGAFAVVQKLAHAL